MDILIDFGSLATAAVAIASASVAFHRYIAKPTFERIRALHEMVEYQLTPNGGRSMRDAVDRIEERLNAHIAEASQFTSEQRGRQRWYDDDEQEPSDEQA